MALFRKKNKGYDPKAPRPPKFYIVQDNNVFYWKLKSQNGSLLAESGCYFGRRRECIKSINTIKSISQQTEIVKDNE